MNSSVNQLSTIYVNGRFLTQPISGVQAFARSICLELIENKVDIKILVPENSEISNGSFAPYLIFTGKQKGQFWEQFHLPGYMRQNPDSVLLNLCNTGPIKIHNQVVTIHDLAFLINKKWFHPLFRYWYKFMVPKLIENSKYIFTVSESVKKELISYFKINESKITVVANKVSKSFLESDEKKPTSFNLKNNPFFLMVGSDNPRKNFAFVEKEFYSKKNNISLVIVGGKNRNFGNTKHVASPKIFRPGYISDEQLHWLYKNAVALINPSFYEGYGIPNLEALALNCPVLCSDIPVFREVCGEAAIYFSPDNRDSLKNAVSEALKNNDLVNTKTKEGKVIFTRYQNQNRSLKILKALFE